MKARSTLLLAALAATGCATSPPASTAKESQGHALRAEHVADRWFVAATAANGEKLEFFTDTGGGFIVHADSAARAGLAVSEQGEGEERAKLAPFPTFVGSDALPPPLGERQQLFVAERSPRSADFRDGMLGQEWFGGRVWTFDYPNGAMAWHDSAAGMEFDPAHTVPLGFPAKDGVRTTSFPRIEATIDGETISFLFDTGATLALSDDALARLGDGGAKVRGTSFIVASIFDRWHAAHPDWRVVERAEDNAGAAPIIAVPEVTIAGHAVGPVWFTRRPDSAFHEYMSQWMDARVEGALGGSAFRWFRVDVDYPGARAAFRRE